MNLLDILNFLAPPVAILGTALFTHWFTRRQVLDEVNRKLAANDIEATFS